MNNRGDVEPSRHATRTVRGRGGESADADGEFLVTGSAVANRRWLEDQLKRTRPGDRLLLAGLCLVVASWIAALVFMSDMAYSGDEQRYARDAKILADLLLGRQMSLETAARAIVGNGWFMPGMSIVLVPVFAIDPEPAVAVVRAYSSAVILLLWLCALRQMSATLGRYAAIVLLVFPSLALMWLVYATTIWGDLPAGLVLTIAAARTYRMCVRLFEEPEAAMPLRDVVILELLLAAMTYLRGNTIVVVVAVHALIVAAAIIARQDGLLLRFRNLAVGVAVFAAVLAPWSVTATQILGSPVLTTSSAALSVGITFGDTKALCRGPCSEDRKPWDAAARYSREQAKERGISELEVQREMSARALRDVTLGDYTAKVRRNFSSFVWHPASLIDRFTTENRFTVGTGREFSASAASRIQRTVRGTTNALYFPFFALLVLANVAVILRFRRLQILSLCVKVVTISLFVQPFLHFSHSRYWVTWAAAMTLAGVMALHWASAAGVLSLPAGDTVTYRPDAAERNDGDWMLSVVQAVYVAAVAAIVLVVLFA